MHLIYEYVHTGMIWEKVTCLMKITTEYKIKVLVLGQYGVRLKKKRNQGQLQ